MTRGDKIRSMTDEELVDMIFACDIDGCIDFCRDTKKCNEKLETDSILEADCKRCLVEWLREEQLQEGGAG